MNPADDSWPGLERRSPSPSHTSWAIRRPLAEWLRAEAAAGGRGLRVLDVGCGVKPYYPFFAAHAAEYVGVDLNNPAAELQGSAESLPAADGSYDVVLCNQLLEHAEDPGAVVRELHRVTASGGRVLASTHGVMVYHPNPDDLWRWTHTGLERLFRRNGDWSSVTVVPAVGTAGTVGMLLATYTHLFFKRLHAPRLAEPLVALVNRVCAAVDRRVPLLRGTAPGTIAANYHVTAVKA